MAIRMIKRRKMRKRKGRITRTIEQRDCDIDSSVTRDVPNLF